jgi:hypothetical protein
VIAAVAAEPIPRYLPTQANAQAANAADRWAPEKGSYEVEALKVLTLDVTEVKAMTAFMPLTSSGTSACPVSSFSRGEPVRPCPKEHAPHGALRGDSRSSPVTAGSLLQEYDKGAGRKSARTLCGNLEERGPHRGCRAPGRVAQRA